MNLSWNLESIYPRKEDQTQWDLDWTRIQTQEDSSLDAKLFNYAYTQFQFNSRRTTWKPRLDQLTEQEWELIPKKSYFQLSTSLDTSQRELALITEFESSEPIQESLFLQIKADFQREIDEERPLLNYLDLGVLDVRKTLRPQVKDWIDFGFPLDYREWTHRSTEDYFKLARDFFYNENSAWGEEIDQLAAQGCLEILANPDKLPGAFTLPMPYGHRPLVYVREVASYESLMALIHELAHGIDFSGRRHEPNGFEIPETPHVEAFSQRAELTFCKRLDPSGVLHDARLELICAKQIFWYVLKKRWLLNFPETLVEARAQWRTYLLEVFGRNFNLRPQLDLLWLTHRGLKQSLRETQNYLML